MKSVKNSATFIRTAALFAWVVILLLPSVAPAQQSIEPKRVLVLYWYGKDFPANVRFDQSFQAALRSAPAGTVEYYPVYLEDDRFPGERQASNLRNYLQHKYADRTIDVVVAAGHPAFDFLIKNRDRLFTNTPIVFVMSTYPMNVDLAAEPGLTGIVTNNTHKKTLEMALRLHPETEQVFIISGTLEHDKRIERLAREELAGYESRVQITYLTDFSLDELIAKTKSLPERSIALYVWQQLPNQQGKLLESPDVLALISRTATVPIYGMSGNNIGRGMIGGYVFTTESNATRVSEIALRILNGVRSQDIPVENAPTVPMFDWREMRRWRIREDRLPPDSIVRFKELSFWEQHKWYIGGVLAVFVIQTLLIVFLSVERARRKSATQGMQESEERFSKAFHSSPQPMSIATLDVGRYVNVNQRFLEVSGYTREELIGRTALELNIWGSPEARDELITPLKEGQVVRNLERIFITKRNEPRVFLSSADLIEVDGQSCVLVASSDITDRKRTEAANLRRAALRADINAALAEAESSLQCILQKCAEAVVRHLDAAFARIWTLNYNESVLELQASAGLYTHLNGRHSRVPVGEFKIGQIAQERLPHLTNDVCNDPRVHDREWATSQGMVAVAGYPLIVEDRIVGVVAMFARHQVSEDTVEALATVAAPIAQGIERKRAEQALSESEERFRSAFDHATIGMALVAPDGRFLQVNRSVCELLGYSEQELLATDFQSLTHPGDLDANVTHTRQTLAGEIQAFQMDKRYIHKQGHTVWASLGVSLLRDADGQPLYFISQIQ